MRGAAGETRLASRALSLRRIVRAPRVPRPRFHTRFVFRFSKCERVRRREPRRPRRGGVCDVQAELLLRVRRAREACALARLDEPSFLRRLRASFQTRADSRSASARVDRGVRVFHVRACDREASADGELRAGRARPHASARARLRAHARREARRAGKLDSVEARARVRPRRHSQRAPDRPQRSRIHLWGANEEGDSLQPSRARPRPLLAAQRDASNAPAVETDRAGMKSWRPTSLAESTPRRRATSSAVWSRSRKHRAARM